MLLGSIMLVFLIVLTFLYIGEAGWQFVAGVWGVFFVGTFLLGFFGLNGVFIWMFQVFTVASIYLKAQSS